jgi:hypothetical protein
MIKPVLNCERILFKTSYFGERCRVGGTFLKKKDKNGAPQYFYPFFAKYLGCLKNYLFETA